MVKRRRVARKSAEQKPELDLPTELLELILSRLSIRDKVRASLVCKKWKSAVASIQKYNRPPVLMSIRRYNDSFEYCDLHSCHTSVVKAPETMGGICYHANHGWMLMYDRYVQQMAFFSPSTHKFIELPRLPFMFDGAAFSTPPTLPDCVVFTMRCLGNHIVEITTWRPGDTAWTTVNYNGAHFSCFFWNCVAVCSGVFFCMGTSGQIGVYDPEGSTWNVRMVEPLKCTTYMNIEDWRQRLFMAQYKGDIFMVRTYRVVRPVVYKLDETNNTWLKVKSLGGATFFANSTNSIIREDMHSQMRDAIYFSRTAYSGRHCVMFSLWRKRYNIQNQKFDSGEIDCDENIWVEMGPPPSSRRSRVRANWDCLRTFALMRREGFNESC